MARKNEAHDAVVESLTEALLQLMEKKPLAEVSISELCHRAGVSRISFYRNYGSMNNILVQHLTKCTDDWWAEFSKLSEAEFYERFWGELLEQYRKNRELILLLYKNNVSYLLKEHIFFTCRVGEAGQDTEDAYKRAALAGCIYGLVDEWIRQGMGDFPEGFSINKLRLTMPV